MFGLVRSSKVKELERETANLQAKVNELEKRLSSSDSDEEDEFFAGDVWAEAKKKLLDMATKNPTPENLRKVEESVNTLDRLAKREKVAQYRAEHGSIKKRARARSTAPWADYLDSPEAIQEHEDDLHGLFLDLYGQVKDKTWFKLVKGRVNDYVRDRLKIEGFDLDELQDPGKFDLVMKAVLPRLREFAQSAASSATKSGSSAPSPTPGVVPGINPRNPAPLVLQNGVPVGQLNYGAPPPAPPAESEQKQE